VPLALVGYGSLWTSIPILTDQAPLVIAVLSAPEERASDSFSKQPAWPHDSDGVDALAVSGRDIIALLSGPRRAMLLLALFTHSFFTSGSFARLTVPSCLAERDYQQPLMALESWTLRSSAVVF